ncbi:MAG: YjbH domain-containing protein [Deltaproteobacteria bacterium]|nr:YjbH domain-containing protein [Deltaproteobacteria bacterium]
MKCFTRLIFFLAFLAFLAFPAFAGDEPFTGPSNWGGTGLMEIPTARVMRENSYRLGFSQIDPYRYYYGTLSPFNGLEIDGRITEILGTEITSSGWQGYGNYKDKAIDLKYQLVYEDKYMPVIAIGIMDPHGTRNYSSQYLVASKQIYPFDFTLGFGNGRFGNRPLPSQGEGIKIEMISEPTNWLKDSQFFWGVQFAPSDKYALMVEYSPIKYHEQTSDPAYDKYLREPVPSNYNFGFRWKPLKWAEVDLTYQRGNRVGVNLSTNFDIGKPIIPIYNPPYKENPELKLSPLSKRTAAALGDYGFSDIAVKIGKGEIQIEAQNDKYYYDTEALGIILQIISEIKPYDIDSIHITLKKNGIPMFEFATAMSDIKDLYAEKLTSNEFLYLSKIRTDKADTLDMRAINRKPFQYGFRPSFQTFLNDPSGFFKYRLGLSGWTSYHPWEGASFVAGLEVYPLNTVATVNEPLSIPVRSDIVLYKDEHVSLGRLMFEQIHKMQNEVYGRLGLGYLEVQYAGVDAEIAKSLFGGRVMLGLSGSIVKKRDEKDFFALKENSVKDFYSTSFLDARLNIPEQDISIDLKIGRFLAGDVGSRITISKFINGVILSAWYSVTDTSVFNDNVNRGYSDKGIAVTIPIRLFKGADSKTAYSYALSPWTRDTGQDIERYGALFDFIGRNIEIYLDRDKKEMYK